MFKIFEFLIELFGWFKIIASPLIAGLVIGGIIYFNKRNTVGLMIGVAIVIVGLVVGTIWATHIWKKQGTIQFLSRIMATPDLDNKDELKQ